MNYKTEREIKRCLTFNGGRSRPDKSAQFVLPLLSKLIKDMDGRERNISLLDVGCGRGSFGYILRAEFGNLFSVYGIEANRKYIDEDMTRVYERIWIEDYLNTYMGRIFGFEVFLFVDVLEHFEERQAIQIIDYIKSNSPESLIIASIPNAEKHWHQSEAYEKANPFEKHRHNWTNEQVKKDLGLNLVGEYDAIGVFSNATI